MNKINNFKMVKNKNQQKGLQKLYSILRDHGLSHEEALRNTVAIVLEVMTDAPKKKAP